MLTLTTPKTKSLWSSKLSLKATNLHNTLETYSEMVDYITQYCVSVRNLPSITLENPADWYTADFICKYASCKAHTSQWTDNGILMKLLLVPQNIVNYNKLYHSYTENIINYIQIIISSPLSDIAESSKKQLKLLLNTLGSNVKLCQDEIQDVQNSIKAFTSDVVLYKDFFKDLYKNSLDTKQADDDIISKYTSQIDILQLDLKKWSEKQKNISIALGVEAVFVPVALSCGPFGIIVGIILGASMIAEGISLIAIDQNIKDDSYRLSELMQQSSPYTRDAAILSKLIHSLEKLTQTLEDVYMKLEKINYSWKQLEYNITQVVTTLDNVVEKEKEGLYKELIVLIQESDVQWEKVVNIANEICLNAALPQLDQVYTANIA